MTPKAMAAHGDQLVEHSNKSTSEVIAMANLLTGTIWQVGALICQSLDDMAKDLKYLAEDVEPYVRESKR